MALVKDMISSQKIQLLKASFLVHLIATDYSEVIYDEEENINPFWEIDLHAGYNISHGCWRDTKDFLRTFNTESNFFM